MATWRILGDKVVPEQALLADGEAILSGIEPGAFRAGRKPGEGPSGPGGLIGMGPVQPAAPESLSSFTAVGFGRPLMIDIRHVYSGTVGVEGLFREKSADTAVVSGVKEWSEFKATARALNWIAEGTKKRMPLPRPSALSAGSALVCYQRAVVTSQLLVSFELAASGQKAGVGQFLSKAFERAAGIPLFMPYSGALLAASQLLPATFDLLSRITSRGSDWEAHEELNFGHPGTEDADAGFRLVASSRLPADRMRFKAGAGLIDASGNPYSGDEPYIIIGIDGAPQKSLESFTPTVASAEILRRFKLGENGDSPIDGLLDLMTIVSDVKFREEAMRAKEELDDLAPGEPAHAKAKARFDALVKNIVTKQLRPA
jgi:hypothetical protein